MRRAVVTCVVAGLSLAGGCEWIKNAVRPANPGAATGPIKPRSADDLVKYLNDQSALLTTLHYKSMSMVVTGDGRSVNLTASSLAVEKPRGLSLTGGRGVFGKLLQVGSNDDEFWVYAKTGLGSDRELYVYCKHADLPRVADQLPIPFDPDWATQALGMGKFPPRDYAVEQRDKEREHHLRYQAATPQGQPVTVTVVFAADEQSGRSPQVRRYVVEDANRQVIGVADIKEVSRHPVGNSTVAVPARLVLSWPQQKSGIDFDLGDDVIVNAGFTPAQRQALFTRPQMSVEARNLADIARFGGLGAARGAAPEPDKGDLPPRAFRRQR